MTRQKFNITQIFWKFNTINFLYRREGTKALLTLKTYKTGKTLDNYSNRYVVVRQISLAPSTPMSSISKLWDIFV